DGNILALYHLMPKQKINVELLGSARMFGNQINPLAGGKLSEISPELVKSYTTDQKYWEVSSEQIQQLAKNIYDPTKNVSQNAQLVYDYVVKNVHYDFNVIKEDFVDRKGALATLAPTTKTGACMEFSDLFISLTRAIGIPSRELNGYAFSNTDNVTPLSISLKNGDLLHAWPEYYDPVFGWVAVDPTWGSTSGVDYFTKLDTNHFVFSILGLNSEYPFPAGAYRFDDSGKQVEVAFAQNISQISFSDIVRANKEFTFNIFQMLKGNSKYKITNVGGTILYDIEGSDQTLLPFSSVDVYIPNSDKFVTYKDFKGNLQELNL
ncbi:MAG TPA: transglutaminase-like domain-containing protein, partial [Candidatus Saccharimonadales bacterium]|nr:transglutaminase-like domain-containing protein [Candidatus Saccharimonadales bacterium]